MIHTYTISGMTCEGCKAKVQYLLEQVKDVQNVNVDLEKGEATITMEHHIQTEEFQRALMAYPKYQLSQKQEAAPPVFQEEEKNWLQTYKPVLLIFAFITGSTVLIQFTKPGTDVMQWMNQFMAGFFLVFSFFKLLNLKGFADSYSMYDIIAKRWKVYGYIYAFLELGLGVAYLTEVLPLLVNSITFIIMSIGLIGVLQSVLNKSKIKCACLGDVFNLPMSTVTIIEDALMLIMALVSILYLMS